MNSKVAVTNLAPKARRVALFVIGMGRSGTSALTRVLSLCGASLPEALLAANEANPRGYWEPLDSVVMNENFLRSQGMTSYDPSLYLQGEIIISQEARESYIERICEFLIGTNGALVVIKDPRITLLSDFWFEASQRAGFATKIVIPVRRPDEVVASLAVRDRLPLEFSSALWLKFSLLAERCSRALPRVFVEFPNLLRNWRGEIKRIASALSLELTPLNSTEIEAFLDHDLHRQKNFPKSAEVFALPWIQKVYELFSAAAQGMPLNAAGERTLDDAYASYSNWERMLRVSLSDYRTRFGPPDPLQLRVEELGKEVSELRDQITRIEAAASTQITAYVAEMNAQTERIKVAERQTAQQEEELARYKRTTSLLDSKLDGICNSRSWKIVSTLQKFAGALRKSALALRLTPKLLRWALRLRTVPSRKLLLQVQGSGLFDPDFYLHQNPDVAAAQVPPLIHYVSKGAAEGRDPHPLIDSAFYLRNNPDVAQAGLNPLVHYFTHGAAEGRDPHPLFDTSFYLENNPDVAKSGMNPLLHFVMFGAAEGRRAHPEVDGNVYALALQMRMKHQEDGGQ